MDHPRFNNLEYVNKSVEILERFDPSSRLVFFFFEDPRHIQKKKSKQCVEKEKGQVKHSVHASRERQPICYSNVISCCLGYVGRVLQT